MATHTTEDGSALMMVGQEPMVVEEEMTIEPDEEEGAASCATFSSPFQPFRKIFKPEEMRQALMPALEALYRQDPDTRPIRQPTDPVVLDLPHYFDMKNSVDLSIIQFKLDAGQYQEPWQYVDDVWLMFHKAWLFNCKTSDVYKYYSKLAKVFESEIDPVMQALGYCCGRKYEFSAQALCCHSKQLCTIPPGGTYYSYQNRYFFCEKCFVEIQGESVTFEDDLEQPQTILKDQFEWKKNDAVDPEPFVECKACGRKMHQICVLHCEAIWPSGFICDNCLKKSGKTRKENKFSAKRLQSTRLGMYIEDRVNNYLKSQNHPEAGQVLVRVVASSDKTLEVKSGMKARFVDTNEMPGAFPYRTKTIFAFEEIDGEDVCLFGMHVQEYGSECPVPNTRRVYISYLDSVHVFRPQILTTAVCSEILIGYLDYVKKLGYVQGHIWACPPCEGDDYIFHCHPPDQKISTPEMLQEWYRKTLDSAVAEKIVHEYKDIFKQATENHLTSASELPYFEGDFWPNMLEQSIKELEEEERQTEENAAACETLEGTPSDSKNAKKKSKNTASENKSSISETNKKPWIPTTANHLSQKLYATMERHKEVFFVIHLHSSPIANSLSPIVDPDPLLSCDLMDGRDAFLTLARDKHWEFSSLRRCKWSTMCMLVELHNQCQDRFVYTCNECKHHVKICWHCTVCEDFYLCMNCYNTKGHEHQMMKRGHVLDDHSNSQSGEASKRPQKRRPLSIQHCIRSLAHACQCHDATCSLPSCQKMKKVVQHIKKCKCSANGGCPVCKQLIALCCCHAKYCQESICPVPLCPNIKFKLCQKQLKKRFQQVLLMRRRMATMQGGTMPLPSPPASAAPGTHNFHTQPNIPHPPQQPLFSQPQFHSSAGVASPSLYTSPHSHQSGTAAGQWPGCIPGGTMLLPPPPISAAPSTLSFHTQPNISQAPQQPLFSQPQFHSSAGVASPSIYTSAHIDQSGTAPGHWPGHIPGRTMLLPLPPVSAAPSTPSFHTQPNFSHAPQRPLFIQPQFHSSAGVVSPSLYTAPRSDQPGTAPGLWPGPTPGATMLLPSRPASAAPSTPSFYTQPNIPHAPQQPLFSQPQFHNSAGVASPSLYTSARSDQSGTAAGLWPGHIPSATMLLPSPPASSAPSTPSFHTQPNISQAPQQPVFLQPQFHSAAGVVSPSLYTSARINQSSTAAVLWPGRIPGATMLLPSPPASAAPSTPSFHTQPNISHAPQQPLFSQPQIRSSSDVASPSLYTAPHSDQPGTAPGLWPGPTHPMQAAEDQQSRLPQSQPREEPFLPQVHLPPQIRTLFQTPDAVPQSIIQELLRIMRSPISLQQQHQQILSILRSNPYLMAAFFHKQMTK
ncbi:CREB-binding protein-like [Thalassophryne amazonica]|uniref:CREB-binding protein-like n=1 Tax=Thalassophryne amazonica TaxID=390379 RepID=UPI001470AF2D|nr:CREB-binding protein-like [Thalassophryne amazonica]